MIVFTIAACVLAVIGFTFGLACGLKLWRWEKQLSQARVAIFYKGKPKLSPRLIDLLTWSLKINGDDPRVRGQAIFRQGGLAVELRKPIPPPKQTTKVVKEKQAA